MKLLCQHIAFLLSRCDCVIVPGLGAFIASYEPARYDENENCLTAPCRTVVFNGALTRNDGILIGSVAQSEGVSYERASEIVGHEVDTMLSELHADGHLTIKGVGILTDQLDSTPTFEQYENSAANAAYWALPSIEGAKADLTESEIRAEENVAGLRPRRFGAFRAIASVAASMALLLGLGFTLTMPRGAMQSGSEYASLAPVRPSNVITGDVLSDGELFIAMPGEGAWQEVDTAAHNSYVGKMRQESSRRNEKPVRSVSDRKAPNKSFTADVQQTGSGDFCIVVASHDSREKAERWIAEQGDSRLRILKSGKRRYRVYVASRLTKEAAHSAITDFSGRYAGAWVCER